MKMFGTLAIETTAACNRTCRSCPRQTYPKQEGNQLPMLRTVETKVGEGNQMPLPLFKKIINDAADMKYTGGVWLQYYSEPLLDDRLVTLGRYAKKKLPKATIKITSNADLMTPERAQELDGVFDYMLFSLYMGRERQKTRKAQLRKMFKKTRLEFAKGDHALSHFGEGPLDQMISKVVGQRCTRNNNMFLITWTGEVAHCCEDINADFGIGNLNQQSLREIWYGPRHQSVVKTLSKPGGRKSFEYCRSCPKPDSRQAARPRTVVRATPGHAR